MFNYLLLWFDWQWLVFFSCFLIIINCLWSKDLLNRFITPKRKDKNILLRICCRGKKKSTQFFNIKLYSLCVGILFLIILIIWYYLNSSSIYVLYQVKLNLWSWYYLILILIVVTIIIKFYRVRSETNSVNKESAGVLISMSSIFLFYMNIVSLIGLIIIFECQNMLFMYFISIIQIIKQKFNLKGFFTFVVSKLKQRFLWQSSTLLTQYWASFFGVIGLVLCCIFWGTKLGSITWVDLDDFNQIDNFELNNLNFSIFIGCLFITSILVKNGLFPFFFWKPDLYKKLSIWGMFWYVSLYTFSFFLLVLFILKFYIFNWVNKWYYIFWLIFIISSILLINVLFSIVEFKPFLAYMSVFHILFMLTNVVINFVIGNLYSYLYIHFYLLFMINLFAILFSVYGKSINYLTDLQVFTKFSTILAAVICALASMSGIPPFLGFWGKIGIILSLYSVQEYTLGSLCLISGLFLLYFYFQNYRFIGIVWAGVISMRIFIQKKYIYVVFFIYFILMLNSSISFLIGDGIIYSCFLMLLGFLC